MKTSTKVLLIVTGVILGICMILGGIYLLGGWKLTVTLKGEETMQVSYGSSYQEPGADGVLTGLGFVHIPVSVETDPSDLNESVTGDYTIRYYSEVLGITGMARRTVQIVDDTPPEITLNHIPDYYTRPGAAYEEEGYTATDNYDGDLTEQVQHKEENGVVTYTVTDSAGNSATVEREIVYDDREPPVITLEGDNPLTVEKGTDPQDPGYTATDDVDGDVTASVTVKQEDGVLNYSVTDAHGNTGTAQRSLVYVDTTPPEITLNGLGEMTIQSGDSYQDPGYTATDAGDGDLTDQVTTEGGVDPGTPGDYTITYSATDSAGNTGTAQRLVHVKKPAADPGNKVIYLTFDDGPGPYTQQLLDVLAKYNVKATFFVTNSNSKYQDMIAAEYNAGHSIGIHTYCHDYNKIYASEDAYFADLQQMQDVIVAQTGESANIIRFPGGSSNTVSDITPGLMTILTQEVQNKGYQYFDWNVSSGDAGETTSTEQVVENVISGIQKHNVSIVLQHDIKSFSVDAVEEIIQWGLDNGYTFLPLHYDSPAAHHHINN